MKTSDGVGLVVAVLAVGVGAALAGYVVGVQARWAAGVDAHEVPAQRAGPAVQPEPERDARDAMLHVIALGEWSRATGRLSEQFGDVLAGVHGNMPTLQAGVRVPMRATRRLAGGQHQRQWWYSVQVEVSDGMPSGILVVELLRGNGDSAGVMCWDLARTGGGIYGGWANVPPVGAEPAAYAVDRLVMVLLGMGDYMPEPVVGRVPLHWEDADVLLEGIGYDTPRTSGE